MKETDEFFEISKKEKKEINIKLMILGFTRSCIRISISIGLIIVSVVVFSLALFDITKDTFSITNYGFAIMAAYTSICFSWTRNLDSNKDEYEIVKINSIAHRSLYSGITFLLGSLFKYIIIANNGFIFVGNYNLTSAIQWTALVCIGYAVLLFCFVSVELLDVIDLMKKKQKKKILEGQLAGTKIQKELDELLKESEQLMNDIEEKKKQLNS